MYIPEDTIRLIAFAAIVIGSITIVVWNAPEKEVTKRWWMGFLMGVLIVMIIVAQTFVIKAVGVVGVYIVWKIT